MGSIEDTMWVDCSFCGTWVDLNDMFTCYDCEDEPMMCADCYDTHQRGHESEKKKEHLI